MNFHEELYEVGELLNKLSKTGDYDVKKYCCSLRHMTSQLEYFYCHLVPECGGNSEETFYHLSKRPCEHQLAYFNIGRGFPKELCDGHWCYVLKDLGTKMLIIPSTSIKDHSKECHPNFEMDIDVVMRGKATKSRIQLSDIRSVDVQRLDLRKRFCKVLTPRINIVEFVKTNLLG
jgi:hypothetical protein